MQMPGKPVEGAQLMVNALGKLTLHSFAAEDSGAAYTIFYVDFPDAALKADPSDLLNAAVTRVMGSNTIASQKIDRQGNPGMEVEGEDGAKGYMRYEAVLAKTRLYELVVLTSDNGTSAQDAGRFLDSFQIASR